MRREKAINVFLFFLLQAMLFVCFCPVYFSVGVIHVRAVSLPERMFSLLFVLLWVSLCVYTAWKKRLSLLVGGALYAVMAYLPGWFLPHLTVPAGSIREQGLIPGLLEMVFNKMYELVSAPLAGVSLLVSEKSSTSISRWLLPILLIVMRARTCSDSTIMLIWRNSCILMKQLIFPIRHLRGNWQSHRVLRFHPVWFPPKNFPRK